MVNNLLSQVMVKKAPQAFDTKAMVAAIESGYSGDRKEEFKTKKSFSPSTLVWGSGACPRYWHLAFDGAVFAGDGDINPKNIAAMANGTASHARLQKTIKNAGILHSEEIKVVQADPPIFGYCDVILEWDGKLIPGEIKTMREEAFAYRKATGKAPGYHLAQILIYMRELGADLGVMIYESKNSHELMVIPVEMTDEYNKWLDELYAWMREVRSTWSAKTLAKKPYRSNSKVCKGCPLLSTCKKSAVGDIAIKPMKMLGDEKE